MEWLPVNWVDAAMVGLIVLSALVGLFRGLTFELLSLAGWFAAYFAATWASPFLAPWLPIGDPGSMLNLGVAFACAFLLVLVVWSLAARAVASLVRATPLRPLDRIMGALFGIARAGVVLLAVATLVSFTPAARTEAWSQSQGAAWLDAFLRELVPLWPESMPGPRPGAVRV